MAMRAPEMAPQPHTFSPDGNFPPRPYLRLLNPDSLEPQTGKLILFGLEKAIRDRSKFLDQEIGRAHV